MNDTGMMREAWDSGPNMSFNQKAETTGFMRPYLESHYHVHMNQLILSTRRIGISVEGYFQRFGKFCTQDGIRKVDSKQFRDAVANLDNMQWAKDNPYQVDQMFDAIIIAFENMQRAQLDKSVNFNQTITSNTPDMVAEPIGNGLTGETTLTLEQIGQTVYHNSSVEIDQYEAKSLQELHALLYEKKMLDKLRDMVTFMNWERDSSCTIDQFKSLLMDTMKLEGKFSQEKLDILL